MLNGLQGFRNRLEKVLPFPKASFNPMYLDVIRPLSATTEGLLGCDIILSHVHHASKALVRSNHDKYEQIVALSAVAITALRSVLTWFASIALNGVALYLM